MAFVEPAPKISFRLIRRYGGFFFFFRRLSNAIVENNRISRADEIAGVANTDQDVIEIKLTKKINKTEEPGG